MSLSLPTLFCQILDTAKKLGNVSAIEDETQELVFECLNNLKTLRYRISELAIFSPNETLEDIASRDLVYLVVPYIFAEVQGRLRTTARVDRMDSLVQGEKYVKNFIGLLEKYDIIPGDERALFDQKTANVADFGKRRELKIIQYKKERDLRSRIETIRKRTGHKPILNDSPTDFDLVLSLLAPASPKTSNGSEEIDSETDEILRETTLLLLRLFYTHAGTQLQAMEQELELLRNAPPSQTTGPQAGDDSRDKRQKVKDDDWKLDIPVPGGPDGKGPLMDLAGKPLRPFTILPSYTSERARLQGQVFGPGHRLPTMTVDEYLEIERQMGNIITGGGPASQAAPTSSEQLLVEAEMDGTVEGSFKEETKRQKDENWAIYTDENPRGAGNTMNRG